MIDRQNGVLPVVWLKVRLCSSQVSASNFRDFKVAHGDLGLNSAQRRQHWYLIIYCMVVEHGMVWCGEIGNCKSCVLDVCLCARAWCGLVWFGFVQCVARCHTVSVPEIDLARSDLIWSDVVRWMSESKSWVGCLSSLAVYLINSFFYLFFLLLLSSPLLSSLIPFLSIPSTHLSSCPIQQFLSILFLFFSLSSHNLSLPSSHQLSSTSSEPLSSSSLIPSSHLCRFGIVDKSLSEQSSASEWTITPTIWSQSGGGRAAFCEGKLMKTK